MSSIQSRATRLFALPLCAALCAGAAQAQFLYPTGPNAAVRTSGMLESRSNAIGQFLNVVQQDLTNSFAITNATDIYFSWNPGASSNAMGTVGVTGCINSGEASMAAHAGVAVDADATELSIGSTSFPQSHVEVERTPQGGFSQTSLSSTASSLLPPSGAAPLQVVVPFNVQFDNTTYRADPNLTFVARVDDGDSTGSTSMSWSIWVDRNANGQLDIWDAPLGVGETITVNDSPGVLTAKYGGGQVFTVDRGQYLCVYDQESSVVHAVASEGCDGVLRESTFGEDAALPSPQVIARVVLLAF